MKRTAFFLTLLFLGCILIMPVWAGQEEETTGLDLNGTSGSIKEAAPTEETVVEYELNLKEDMPETIVSPDQAQVNPGLIRVTAGSDLLKTDPPQSKLTYLRTVSTKSLPKGMEFTRDGKLLFVALLGQPVIEVIDWETLEVSRRIEPLDRKYLNDGFVEIGISPFEDAVLTSQMTTGSVHRIPLTGDQAFQFTDSVSTRGNWSKVITFSNDGRTFAVSNWTSYDVSFFTYPEMEFVKKVKIPGIPRGMVFAEQDKTLYVTNYSNGSLHKVDIEAGKITNTVPSPKKGALRHLAIDEERQILYASDMYWRLIYIYDLSQNKLIKQIKVDSNPNTIALTPDKKHLFVSCRGPNAKTSYLDRSPRSGRLYMIDCETQEVLEYRVLGNQPTALAVHPSGEYVAVSNFRDNNIEIYRIEGAR